MAAYVLGGAARGIMDPSDEQGSPGTWVKSSYSMTNGNCVEVAGLPGHVIGVRDSKASSQGHILRFAPREWDSFTVTVRSGRSLRPWAWRVPVRVGTLAQIFNTG